MRSIVAPAVMSLVLLGCVSSQAQPARTGLSGTWQRDNARSDALTRRGQPVADPSVTLVIEQSAPTVNVKRVVATGPQSVVRQLTYSTDGKENKNLNPRGAEVITRSQWDGARLVTKGRQTLTSPMGPVDADVSETWTVSSDGGTLTIESTTSGPVIGEIRRKEVFIRKG